MPSNTTSRSRPAADPHRRPAPQHHPSTTRIIYKNSGRKRKKKRNHMISYLLLILFCISASIVLSYSVFFKVESIKVVGNESYSSKEIIDLVGVSSGDSLFQINTSSGESRLETKLPFVREARLVRRLPSTLQIQIIEEELMGAIYTNQGYTIVSTTGKVLKNGVLSVPEGVPCILGFDEQIFEVGTYAKESGPDIKPKDANLLPKVILLQEFYSQIKTLDFSGIDYIDISDKYNLKAFYDKRILISFGTPVQIKEKIELMMLVLEEKQEFEGTIDLSWVGEAHTLPDEAEKMMDPRAYAQFGVLGEAELLKEESPEEIQSAGTSSVGTANAQEPLPETEAESIEMLGEAQQAQNSEQLLSSAPEVSANINDLDNNPSEEQSLQENEASTSDEVTTENNSIYTITLG